MKYRLGDAVKHIFSKQKGVVVANGDDTPHVVVEFQNGSEVLHEAELMLSDHLINPLPDAVAERLNTLLEDSSVRTVASKEFGLEANESIMNVEFLPLSHEIELTCIAGTKIALKKVSVKFAKEALKGIEEQVS